MIAKLSIIQLKGNFNTLLYIPQKSCSVYPTRHCNVRIFQKVMNNAMKIPLGFVIVIFTLN